MTTSPPTALQGHLVDDELLFTTTELCRACSASETEIEIWVAEGVLRPVDRHVVGMQKVEPRVGLETGKQRIRTRDAHVIPAEVRHHEI